MVFSIPLLIFHFLFTSQTPVLNDVRDITIGQTPAGGLIVLIGYENKVYLYLDPQALVNGFCYRHRRNCGDWSWSRIGEIIP